MQKKPVILIGIGEMGGVFSRGLLRAGYAVYPVTRETDIESLAAAIPEPAMVLIAVGETALQPALAEIPINWQHKLALLQNELLPADYAHLSNPTVVSVWFEKKRGQDVKVLIPSPVYGPLSHILIEALSALDIPTQQIHSAHDMLFELVLKNVYILTTNIAGLKVGGTVNELWQQHQTFAREVADDVMDIQEAMTSAEFNRYKLIAAMLQAFAGDPAHKCMGRSAPARLQRALQHADKYQLKVETLREINK